MKFDIERARRLNSAIARIRFAEDDPLMELIERFTLLTVAAGLRQCTLFARIGPSHLQQLRSITIDHGFFPLVSKLLRTWSYVGYDEKIAKIFREVDAAVDRQVLWVCSTEAARTSVSAAPADSRHLLIFPECCVSKNRKYDAALAECSLKAIFEKAGGDPELIRRAIREKWEVEIHVPDEFESIVSGRNRRRTQSQFPFVSHVACDACLENPSSPTAETNKRYADFARQFDPGLYEAIRVESRRN